MAPEVSPVLKTMLTTLIAGPHEYLGDRTHIVGTLVKSGAGGGATVAPFGATGALVPVFFSDEVGNLAKV